MTARKLGIDAHADDAADRAEIEARVHAYEANPGAAVTAEELARRLGVSLHGIDTTRPRGRRK